MATDFGKFERGLRDLQKRMQGAAGEHNVPLPDLFPPEFMQRHSEFATIDALFAASPWKRTPEDFAAIPDNEWDSFIRLHTSFSTWAAMQSAGAREWTARRVSLQRRVPSTNDQSRKS